MAKFCGIIGFEKTYEKRPGVWSKESVEKEVFGDILKQTLNSNTPSKVNDDFSLSNTISIVADSDIIFNLGSLKYVKFNKTDDTKWKITSANLDRPRIVISIGGVYND